LQGKGRGRTDTRGSTSERTKIICISEFAKRKVMKGVEGLMGREKI
jgi:hypothetical protein